MRKFINKPMEELATELKAGLLRLRKGYVDAAEGLVQIIDPGREYPYEFVLYRLTGFRPRPMEIGAQPMLGKTLRSDLLVMMLAICDSFELRPSDYSEIVYDSRSLAKAYRVSTKTVQRWRRAGLPARRLVYPNGRRRIAFLESSVRWFVQSRRKRILRSMRFSQMTAVEKRDVLRRARRMARFTQCTLSDVAKRLAARTGRAMETIRYTIRRHDLDHPDEAIFPKLAAPLQDRQKVAIYRCFLRGVPVPDLARRCGRTRGSVYRVVNEMRALQLLRRPIDYVYNPQFDLPNADEIILAESLDPFPNPAVHLTKPPPGLPQYLRALYEVPLLDRQQERDLFRRYNYLKYKADRLRKDIDLNHVRTSLLRRVEALLVQASVCKNRIIRSNLRLVVSIAKKHLGGTQSLFELISDGNVSLMQAVEKFDFSRGNRFSTYASWAIMRNFARSVPRARYQLDRFSTGQEEILDVAASLQAYDPNEVTPAELRDSVDALLAQLTSRERAILVDHYGLDTQGKTLTLDQVGKRLGISKERVRQIEKQALRKLRRISSPSEAGLVR